MWVVGQAVINIGAVVGLLPVTGIPLPFVSFGGSALVTTMFATGILANVARQGRARRAPRPRRRATVTATVRARSPAAAPAVTSSRRSRSPTSSSRAVTPRDSIRFVGAQRGLEAHRGARGRLRHRSAARAGLRPQRSTPRASCRRTSAPRGTPWSRSPGRCGIVRRAAARASSSASAGTRRCPRWSAARRLARSRPSCTRPTPTRASPTGSRCASVRAPAVSLPGTAAPGRGGHRQPDPARDRRGASGRRSTPPLVAVVGGSLGARSRQPTPPSSLYDRWRDRADVTIHHVTRRPRLRRVPNPARGAARARATRSATGSSRTRTTWRPSTPTPR